MTIKELVESLLDQAKDKQCFADPEDPEDILSKDVEALREAAGLLSKTEPLNAPLTLDELRGMDGGKKLKSDTYYRGVPGVKYGIWNTILDFWQFGICEDTPMLAEARLFQKIGDDPRKGRFEVRPIL